MKIDGKHFGLGENGRVDIDIADLPSGTKIHLPIHVFRSKNEGPTLLITGGLHGDEINGVEIVRQTLVNKFFENLKCGAVVVLPLINIYGFINFSRAVPDGKDVNRSFPGSSKGSLASQVAHVLSSEIIPQIDFGVDFHTGGASRYNFPQIRFTANDEKSKELALAFDAPVSIGNTVIPKSFREAIIKQGKSTIVFEGGEALRYDINSTKEGLAGLKRLLVSLNMIEGEKATPKNTDKIFYNTSWQRAETGGLYIWEKSSGTFVEKGEKLGSIHDPHNTYEVEILAEKSGFIFGHNNAPVINQGDALFHFAW